MAKKQPEKPGGGPPRKERRVTPRLRARGIARVIRDDDVMRVGVEGKLRDISTGGIGAEFPVELDLDEHVKLRLINDVQRFECETRGVVRHVTAVGNAFYVGVELFARLTPRQVGLLKTTLPVDDTGEAGLV
ncbi:MAG: PilZ domain-containing protein [Planctomycetaceae bacterium]